MIDSVTAEFQVTNRHFRFLLIPVALDLALWLGPRVSIEPLLNRIFGLAGLNLMGLVAIAMPSSSRSMFGGSGEAGASVTIGTWPLAFAFIAVLFSAGLLIGALYRSTIVQGVTRSTSWSLDDVFRTFIEAAPRYARLLLVIVGVAMVGLLASSLLVTLLDAIVPGAGGVAITLLTGFILWIVILFFLAESAVFVSGLGALASLRASAQIVRRFLWPSVGLFFLLRLIGIGMGVIWGRVGETSLVTIAVIGGNAYIATGLMVAAMVYYRDRVDLMRWNA